MKRLGFILCALVLFLVTGCSSGTLNSNWQVFNFSDTNYYVRFPEEWEIKGTDVNNVSYESMKGTIYLSGIRVSQLEAKYDADNKDKTKTLDNTTINKKNLTILKYTSKDSISYVYLYELDEEYNSLVLELEVTNEDDYNKEKDNIKKMFSYFNELNEEPLAIDSKTKQEDVSDNLKVSIPNNWYGNLKKETHTTDKEKADIQYRYTIMDTTGFKFQMLVYKEAPIYNLDSLIETFGKEDLTDGNIKKYSEDTSDIDNLKDVYKIKKEYIDNYDLYVEEGYVLRYYNDSVLIIVTYPTKNLYDSYQETVGKIVASLSNTDNKNSNLKTSSQLTITDMYGSKEKTTIDVNWPDNYYFDYSGGMIEDNSVLYLNYYENVLKENSSILKAKLKLEMYGDAKEHLEGDLALDKEVTVEDDKHHNINFGEIKQFKFKENTCYYYTLNYMYTDTYMDKALIACPVNSKTIYTVELTTSKKDVINETKIKEIINYELVR